MEAMNASAVANRIAALIHFRGSMDFQARCRSGKYTSSDWFAAVMFHARPSRSVVNAEAARLAAEGETARDPLGLSENH